MTVLMRTLFPRRRFRVSLVDGIDLNDPSVYRSNSKIDAYFFSAPIVSHILLVILFQTLDKNYLHLIVVIDLAEKHYLIRILRNWLLTSE